RYGPDCPNPVMEQYTSRGFSAESSSQPSPRRESEPTLKFSSSTSDRSASRRTMAWPAGLARSTVTDFLPRFVQAKYADSRVSVPSGVVRKGGPQPRVSSPVPGRSIFTTSAPRSARSWLAQGPARTRERSRTRTWERAPPCIQRHEYTDGDVRDDR